MSLDDIIKSDAESGRGRGSRGGRGGRGGRGRGRGAGKAPPAKGNYKAKLSASQEAGEGEFLVGKRIYVGNLSYRTSWQDLKDLFREAGEVVYADVMRGEDGRSRGCGIVEFSSPEESVFAINNFREHVLDGRPIFIREDREDRELQSAGGGRGGGNRSRRGGGGAESAASSSAPSGTSSGAVGTKVFVNNLSWGTTWQGLKDYFKQAGDVVRADVMTDRSGRSNGCGIVEFSTAAEALTAISTLSNTELDGRSIMVREDREA